MAITDPEVIRWCNEAVRPICERIRALQADIQALKSSYDGGIGDHFYIENPTQQQLDEVVEDGREGDSRLTRADILAFVALVPYGIGTTLGEGGNPATIAKPCVRHLITG